MRRIKSFIFSASVSESPISVAHLLVPPSLVGTRNPKAVDGGGKREEVDGLRNFPVEWTFHGNSRVTAIPCWTGEVIQVRPGRRGSDGEGLKKATRVWRGARRGIVFSDVAFRTWRHGRRCASHSQWETFSIGTSILADSAVQRRHRETASQALGVRCALFLCRCTLAKVRVHPRPTTKSYGYPWMSRFCER